MQLRATTTAVLVLCALAAPAAANPYETFISIDSEEDLYDLQTTGQIEDDTLATLVELYQRGVDLNKATREELYELLGYKDFEKRDEQHFRAASGGSPPRNGD